MTLLPHLPSSHFSTFSSSSATLALSQPTCFWGLIPNPPIPPTPPSLTYAETTLPSITKILNCQTKSRRPQSSVGQTWKMSPWFQGPLSLRLPCSQLSPVRSAHLPTHVLLLPLAVLLPRAVLFCFVSWIKCVTPWLLIKPLHRRCSIQTSN